MFIYVYLNQTKPSDPISSAVRLFYRSQKYSVMADLPGAFVQLHVLDISIHKAKKLKLKPLQPR